MNHVVLCICTCRRPEGLRRLLTAVDELDFDGLLSVVVVENDVALEGLSVCRELLVTFRWPLKCVFEQKRGISFARNRAIQLALEHEPSFIAMLDDDESPSGDWLVQLLRTQSASNSDIVGGPVFPIFPCNSTTSSWLSYYYSENRRQYLRDGESCLLYSTANFIARPACFKSLLPTPFDPAFGTTGGEDALFFLRLAKMGYTMNWSLHGIVYEYISEDRLNLNWLKQRQIRRGNLNVRIQFAYNNSMRNKLTILTKTIAIFTLAILYNVFGVIHSVWRIRALLLLHYAIGKITGHLNWKYDHYGQEAT